MPTSSTVSHGRLHEATIEPLKAFVLNPKRADEFAPLLGALNDEGISSVNMFQIYNEKIDGDNLWDYYWPNDHHFKAAGHVLLAATIEKWITANEVFGGDPAASALATD